MYVEIFQRNTILFYMTERNSYTSKDECTNARECRPQEHCPETQENKQKQKLELYSHGVKGNDWGDPGSGLAEKSS